MRTKDEIMHDIKCCIKGNCSTCFSYSREKSIADCENTLVAELSNLSASLEKPSTCTFGDGVSVKLDGIHELSPHPLKLSQRLKNVTVEILECPKCGETSVGWYRQANTEEID